VRPAGGAQAVMPSYAALAALTMFWFFLSSASIFIVARLKACESALMACICAIVSLLLLVSDEVVAVFDEVVLSAMVCSC
jgi:hypothetical protein